ncbi:ABC transporter ATP-binding protein [Corallococcus silvisoli]|uniref:ABC transporter ATP-binding protein n=1 Tax=Corallococcus silvisoli TaxID=2697031 RepID=UPI001377893E|nr:ABC transporter ATP-binding protein [Corallococcus silvisoli]NBD07805.1 ATP-binding cassette domain-containing protein [Corallococcus silvisoli]
MRRPGSIEALAELETGRALRRGKVFRRLMGEMRPYARTLAVAMAFILVGAACQAVGPYLVSRAIDRDIGAGDGWGLLRTLTALLAVYAVGALSQRAQTRRVGHTGQRVLSDLRLRLFERLQRLPLAWFDRRPLGDLMSRLLSDVDTLNQLFAQGMTQLLGSVLGLVGVLIAMLALNARLALACFSLIPAIVFTTWFFAARARNAYRKTRQTVGDVTANLQEEIGGVRQAQAFNRTEKNIERFRDRNAANRDANVAAVGITSAFSPAIDLLSTLSTALVIGYGGVLALDGRLTVGGLAAFLIYVQQFFRPVQLAASVATLAQSALAGAERIYGILDEAPEPPDAEGAVTLGPPRGEVVFDAVSFGYDLERPVLRDVSFHLEPGQTLALVGRTGAGKTTVASLVPRFYDVTAGAVRIDGEDVRRVTRGSLRQRMAMVLQEPFLFSGKVADNIAYGKQGATREDVEAAAKAVHAHDFITRLPQGYDTVLGEGGATLSQGQRQLLAFARAVIADPRVLILDEATANVDTRTEGLIQLALGKLLSGRTSIVIAHRLNTIRHADLILVLEHGAVVERGNHDELLAKGGLYAELYHQQFRDTPETVKALG